MKLAAKTQKLAIAALAAGAFFAAGAARASTVYVDSYASGENFLNGGSSIGLENPVQITLGPGRYAVTDADTTSGDWFSSWCNGACGFPGGYWHWSWSMYQDDGSNGSTITGSTNPILSSNVTGTWGDQGSAAAAGAANPTQYFTLSSTTTLDIVVPDGYLYDNYGGVALGITQVAAPAPLPALSAPILALLAFGRRLRGQHRDKALV